MSDAISDAAQTGQESEVLPLATVIHELPDGRDFIEVSTVADWLDSQGWPEGWQVFSGDRRLGPDDVALLNDPAATLRIVSVPGEPATIAYAVIAVIAAAYSIYVANSISIPDTSQNRNAATSNNELSNRSNKPAKIGQRIPDIWGLEPRAYPLLLSSYRRFDGGGDEQELSYLLVGAGSYHIASVLDGDTPIENIANATTQFYGPNKSPYRSPLTSPDLVVGSGEIPHSLAPKVLIQSNEIDGITVSAPNAQETSTTLLILPDGWLEITDASSGETLADRFDIGDSIRLKDCFGWEYVNEPYEGPFSGNYSYYLRHDLEGAYTVTAKDSTRVQVTPGSQPGWAHIPVGGQYQALSAAVGFAIGPTGPIESRQGYAPSFPAGSYPTASVVAMRREQYGPAGASAGTNVVGPITVEDCSGVIINLVARNGVYKLDGSTGEPLSDVAEFEIEVAHPTGSITATLQVATNATNRRDSTGSTAEINWSTVGRATVTVTRATNTDKLFAGTVVDEVQWRDLYAVRELPTDYNPGNVTTCLLLVNSNPDASRVKDRKLNMRLVRKLSSDAAADSRFTSVLPALHADPLNGRRDPSTIDTDTLNLLATDIATASLAIQYPVEGRVCGYTFDTTQMTYEDELRLLCRAVNLRPYHIGGDISFVWEYLRDVDCLLTHKDIVPGTFKLQRNFTPSREFTGVELSYKNRVRGEQLTVTAGPQDAPEAIELQGQHYEDMASYAANSAYAKQRYQRISVECEVGQIVRRLAVGMRLHVEDCTRYKSVGGEVASVVGPVLTLTQPVPAGISSVWLSRRNGDAYMLPCTKTGDYQISLSSGSVLPEPLYTDWQERRTRYLLWGSSAATKPLDLIVTEIDVKSGSSGVVRLVNYDERYYQWPLS